MQVKFGLYLEPFLLSVVWTNKNNYIKNAFSLIVNIINTGIPQSIAGLLPDHCNKMSITVKYCNKASLLFAGGGSAFNL